MKKLLLIITFILFTHFSKSQSYQGYVPFPTAVGTAWNSIEGCYDGTFTITGDTVINSLTYHKLRNYGKHYNSNWLGCSWMLGYTIYDNYVGAFRNDSVNKKVYILLPGRSADSLFYDFDIQVGDTLKRSLKFSHQSHHYPFTKVVAYIDTVQYGNVWRKRYTLNYCDMGIFQDTVRLIEGIGSTESFFSPTTMCHSHYYAELYCMKVNGKTIYPDSNTACQPIITSIDENLSQNNKVLLGPNPSTGVVHLKTTHKLQSITVYNLLGEKVQEIAVTKNSWILPNERGIYIVKLVLENGEQISKKLIKQ